MSALVSERLWFQASVEGLFVRGVGEALTPALSLELRALGLDVERLQPAYPAELMTRAIKLTAATLYPERTDAEGLRELGHVFMRGFGQTLIGRAMVQFMRVIGPRRSLERMQRNFRTGSNFIETKFTSVDANTATVWFNDVSTMPEFYLGIIEAGGRASGAEDISVTHAAGPGSDCTFTVSWR